MMALGTAYKVQGGIVKATHLKASGLA